MKKMSYLLEYIDYNKLMDFALEIETEFDFEYEKMLVLRNINNPTVFEVKEGRLLKTNNLFKQDVIIENYVNYFKNFEILKSEIIKLEFEGYNWITIMLCYTKQENLSVVTYSPDFVEFDILNKINTFLERKNFNILKKENYVNKMSREFVSNLVSVFRNISGRSYNSRMFSSVMTEFKKLKIKFSKDWNLFEKWKLKNIGSSVLCVRYMDLDDNMEIMMVDGSMKNYKDIKIDEMFYYPISNRCFSHWAEIDSDINNIKNGLNGILSTTEKGIVCNIPTKKIVLTNKLFLYNFSIHVNEREIIVEHDISDQWDKNLICKLA